MSLFGTPKFEITGYEEMADIKTNSKAFLMPLASSAFYELQVPPDKFDISIGKEQIPPQKDAEGNVLVKGAPGKEKKKWNFSFIVDNTGIFPNLPTRVLASGLTITTNIELLEAIAAEPNDESHKKLFVKAAWGASSIEGTVTTLNYSYTFYDSNANPIRAKVSMEITEGAEESNTFLSPDLSRMPSVKDGDSLVKYCEEYYKEKNFYLKIAEINNLSSFRSLQPAKRILFPPIKK